MNERTLFIFLLCLFSTSLMAQKKNKISQNPTTAKERIENYDLHVKMNESSPFRNLEWKNVSPDVFSGRITDIEVASDNTSVIYIGAASGGVFKSINNGTTWFPVWEHAPSISVGDIGLSHSDPNIVWVGAGENNSSRSSYSGTGVYKSTDGGANWKAMGLEESHHIGRILIHPTNPDIVYVAALGHLYTENPDRGLYKTTNGGKSWKKVLSLDNRTGVIDLVMDPQNPDILYASAWEKIRKAWDMTETGEGSGIYKTTNGGEQWEKLDNGLPSGEYIGRIGLAIAPSNPDRIYALVDNHNDRTGPEAEELKKKHKRDKLNIGAEVYRSDDKGAHWQKINKDDLGDLYYLTISIGYYLGEIRVSPDNEDEIFVLGAPLMTSKDGGETYEKMSYYGLHPDHQSFWIDPNNGDHMINGNDAGALVTYDRGETWLRWNIPISQTYFVAVDNEEPFNVYGSFQDNFCWYGPTSHVNGFPGNWRSFPGGESGYIQIDPENNDLVYASPGLVKWNRKTGHSQNIQPPSPVEGESLKHIWHSPFLLSPHNSQIIYYGGQYLMRSLNQGKNWEKISPNLAMNTPDRVGDVPFGAISCISESPLKFGHIFTGTDDGNVHLTLNGGLNWENINDGLPEKKWVSRIVASKYDQNTVFVSMNGYRDDDFKAYIYKSINNGKDWIDIGRGLPGGPVNVIAEDPHVENLLYAGTDLGVYVSYNAGEDWISLSGQLPSLFVHHLVIHPRDRVLVLGTHGRGFYFTDAVPIQDYQNLQKNELIHLYPTKTSYTGPQDWSDPVGEAHIIFHTPKSVSAKITIKNYSGRVIKEDSIKTIQGINTYVWKYDGLTPEGRKRYFGAGEYSVTIEANGTKAESSLTVR